MLKQTSIKRAPQCLILIFQVVIQIVMKIEKNINFQNNKGKDVEANFNKASNSMPNFNLSDCYQIALKIEKNIKHTKFEFLLFKNALIFIYLIFSIICIFKFLRKNVRNCQILRRTKVIAILHRYFNFSLQCYVNKKLFVENNCQV